MALKYEFLCTQENISALVQLTKIKLTKKILQEIAIERIRTANFTIVIIIVKHFIEENYNQERFNNQTYH